MARDAEQPRDGAVFVTKHIAMALVRAGEGLLSRVGGERGGAEQIAQKPVDPRSIARMQRGEGGVLTALVRRLDDEAHEARRDAVTEDRRDGTWREEHGSYKECSVGYPGNALDPIARAKTAFFACLGVSIALLLLVDLALGPAAFAVPAMPTSSAPEPSRSLAPPPSASASASATVTPKPVATPSATASAAPAAPEVPVAGGPLPKYTGGKMNGVVATFEFEQANADLSALQALAKQMHEDTVSEIVLEGHSDPSGNEYRNLSLSLDRANWAADRLSEYGINRMRIRTVGLGSARPIVDIGGDAGAINRRVEVRWVARSTDGGGG